MGSSIKFATIDDVDEIMKFIHRHWKKNHILSQNKDFFLYEHQDGKRINFVLYKNKNNVLDGILGFIKSSDTNSDIYTVIWKVVSNKERPMLGIELLEFLRNSSKYKVLSGPGVNAKTIGIYKYLNIYTGYLEQFVLLNDKIKNFKIAKILDKKNLQSVQFLTSNKYNLLKISEENLMFNFEKYKDVIPYKDEKYFVKRYFNHPIYKYDIYGIVKGNKTCGLLVMRSVSANNSKALRIVDFIGDPECLKFVTISLHKKIINENYEYVDFMCFGFNHKSLLSAGFKLVDLDSSELIIPNYFSPFVSKNIRINFFVDTDKVERVKMCKADGDQDRPS
jgi:hypothetical protein